MRKRNDFDVMARDVAFEIVLGGDRFEPSDVAEFLRGSSEMELQLFRERIRYHAVDFAPPEHRTDDFLSRMIEAWTKDVVVDSRRKDISSAAREAMDIQDRDRWFRFSDGFRKCTKGTVEAMWTMKDRTMLESEQPVPSNEVLRRRMDSLISRYGHEVRLDGYYDVLDVSSLELAGGNVSMTLRRSVDTLAKGVEGHKYYVVERTPGDMRVSEVMSFTPREAERLISILDTEESLRQSSSLVSGQSQFPDGVLVGFPEPVKVFMAKDKGMFPFEVSSVFCTPDGRAMVSGHYMHRVPGEPEYNFPLSDLTDKGVSDVRKTMDGVMSRTLSRLKEIETSQVVAAGAAVRRKGPSL